MYSIISMCVVKPGIVRIWGVDKDAGRIFMDMKCTGKNFGKPVQKGTCFAFLTCGVLRPCFERCVDFSLSVNFSRADGDFCIYTHDNLCVGIPVKVARIWKNKKTLGVGLKFFV
jgi:hypothetical protein